MKEMRHINICLKKIKDCFLRMFLCVAILCIAARGASRVDAAAQETSGEETDETLTVNCRYKETAIPGVEIALYRVGDLDRNSASFTPAGDFAGFCSTDDLTGLDLAEKNDAQSERLAAAAKDANLAPVGAAVSGDDGQAVFTGLADGLYLLVSQNTGNYGILPALISVPQYDTEEGWLRESEVFLKISAKEVPSPTNTPVPTERARPTATPRVTSAPQPKNASTKAAKTGDTSGIERYAALMLLAAATIGVWAAVSGKRKDS